MIVTIVPVLKVVFKILLCLGDDYFCESGNPNTNHKIDGSRFYTADPLCDDKGLVLLNKLVVKLPVFHGSTRSLTLPLLTTLR